MSGDALSEAVEAGDLDELLRWIDRLCADRDWSRLVRLRDGARRAVERGRQLWPAASHAEYRLALEAPGSFAAAVLVEGAGHFALGPLPEVAASTHTWAELADHVAPGPPAVLAAHERVVRGEDLTGRHPPGPPVVDLPLTLEAWEPRWPVATYRPHRVEAPSPARPRLVPVALPPAPAPLPHGVAVDALLALVEPWVRESGGRAAAVAVDGGGLDAIAALTGGAPVRAAEAAPAEALAWCGWAAASGGAHGRRPGAALGRFGAWWALAALSARLDPWPPPPGSLGEAAAALRWWLWHPEGAPVGWDLHMAVEEPGRGRAWALAAADRG